MNNLRKESKMVPDMQHNGLLQTVRDPVAEYMVIRLEPLQLKYLSFDPTKKVERGRGK